MCRCYSTAKTSFLTRAQDLRRLARNPSHKFQDDLKQSGVKGLHLKTAKTLAEKAQQHWEIREKKLRSADKGLRELTLAALELALGPEAYKHCLIFVSHTDDAWISGAYSAALAGTKWEGRLVVGVRGAHLQAWVGVRSTTAKYYLRVCGVWGPGVFYKYRRGQNVYVSFS